MIIATSADVPHYTQNLFMGHLTIPWLVYTMLVVFPKTQFVSLLLPREPNVNESLHFICKPEQDPQVSKSQESSPSECNFKDFENLESLNRNLSSFAKKLFQNYRCNLLIKFHSSNQGISPIKNSPKEHLKWFQRMAKRSAVIDGLLIITYRDELIEDPNHYRIMVPNDIQLQRHLSRAYHDSPIAINRGLEAAYEALSHDFY